MTGDQVGKRQGRTRARSTAGRVAGAATEVMSGSRPISSSACPAYVLPQSPYPGAATLTPRPDGTAGTLTRAVSSPEVVCGGDQAPFRAGGVSASSVEAVDAAVELRLAEHGLDHRLAFAVKLGAALSRQLLAHG